MGFLDELQWKLSPLRPTVEALEARWKALMDWSVKTKLPDWHHWWEEFDAFEQKISAAKDERYIAESLPTQIDGLNAVEGAAKTQGFPAPAPLAKPEPGLQAPPNPVADAHYSQGDPEATLKFIEKKANDAKNFLTDLPWIKVGIGLGVGLIAIGFIGVWAAKTAAPYAIPLATGGVVRLPREQESTA